MIEKTLSIIKPDGINNNIIGQVYSIFENAGLKIVAAKMTKLSSYEAESFYNIHKSKNFFKELIDFMTSGPIMAQVLYGDNAVNKNRMLMGNTNPKLSDIGTIRNKYASSITNNIVHGSDSIVNANNEISFFFNQREIFVCN